MNPWDALSAKFNGHKDLTKIDPNAADNILIAWPVILGFIEQHFKGKKNLSMLDYGCGAGAFCEKLWTLGYKNIVGMDSSRAMIDLANKKYGGHIHFIQGSSETVPSIQPVDVITGIMVFQFVADIKKVFQNLVAILKPGGLLVFAVHNPAVVTAVLKIKGKLFSDFQSTEKPEQGLINMGGQSIPIYIRTAIEYDEMSTNLGLTKVFEDYPPFTKEFLANYSTEVPDVSNFLILGYQKFQNKKNPALREGRDL